MTAAQERRELEELIAIIKSLSEDELDMVIEILKANVEESGGTDDE